MSELTLSGTTPPALEGGSLVYAEYNGGVDESLLLFKGSDGTGAYFTGDVALQTSVLNLAGNIASEHGANIVRVDEFEGNFKLDLVISDMTTMTASGDKLLMEIISDPDNRVHVGIDGNQWMYWDGTNTITAARTNDYGSIRIQRIGSTIEYSYLDGPGSWTSLGTSEFNNLDIKLVIQGIFDTASKYVDLDTFIVDDITEDDFSGTGDPGDNWTVNVDVYGNINHISDIYIIDPDSGACTTSTPATIPQGEVTTLSYFDRELSGGKTKILSIDILNDIYELDVDSFEWSLIDFANVQPRMGSGHIFSVCFEKDTYTRPVFVLGQGDVGGAQTAVAQIAHQEWEMDVSLSGSVTPTYITLGYEPYDYKIDKMDLEVEGYNGSVWKKITDIPASVTGRTGRSYKLHNDENLSALKIRGRYGLGTSNTPVYITGISLLNDVSFGRITQNEVEVHKPESEILCPVASDGLPTTVFNSLGTETTTAQVYVAKDLDLTGTYKTAVDPGAYPYSVYYTTTDDNRITLSLTEIHHVVSRTLGNVKLAFSFDGRTTWNTYNSGWVSIDISDEAAFRTNGIVADDVGVIPLSAWTPYLNGTVDLSVLLTMDSISDFAYFSTLAFIGPDDEEGKRIITPLNNWISTILSPEANLSLRSFTDIEVSTPTKILNVYDWSTGIHKNNLTTVSAEDKSIHGIILNESPEYLWATMRDDGGNLPILPSSGSFLRTHEAFDLFDYSTGVLTRLEGNTYLEETLVHLRRAFGTGGIIRMTYAATDGAMGYTEIIDSSTSTIEKNITQTFETLGGNGATLANETNSWLTPGSRNLASYSWYNSMIKVDYSNIQRYQNNRCSITESFASGCGGVSDIENYGWMMGASATTGFYSVLKLDYSNDTTGFTEPGSLDVSDLGINLYKSIGCSSPSKTIGYFWLKQVYTGSSNVHRMVKMRYSTDTVFETFRTDATDNGSLSDAVNPQARSTGHTSIYIWTNQSDKTGPAELDLSTDTISRRTTGGYSTSSNYGSQYCGSQSSGLNY